MVTGRGLVGSWACGRAKLLNRRVVGKRCLSISISGLHSPFVRQHPRRPSTIRSPPYSHRPVCFSFWTLSVDVSRTKRIKQPAAAPWLHALTCCSAGQHGFRVLHLQGASDGVVGFLGWLSTRHKPGHPRSQQAKLHAVLWPVQAPGCSQVETRAMFLFPSLSTKGMV